jgi:hypothetical protein
MVQYHRRYAVRRWPKRRFAAHDCVAIRGLSVCTIFFHFISNGARRRKKLLSIKCAFWVSLQLLFKIIQRVTVITVQRSTTHQMSAFSRKILTKTWNFLHRFSEKKSQTKFHENLSSCGRVVSSGETDRHTWRSQQSIFAIPRTHPKNCNNKKLHASFDTFHARRCVCSSDGPNRKQKRPLSRLAIHDAIIQ